MRSSELKDALENLGYDVALHAGERCTILKISKADAVVEIVRVDHGEPLWEWGELIEVDPDQHPNNPADVAARIHEVITSAGERRMSLIAASRGRPFRITT